MNKEAQKPKLNIGAVMIRFSTCSSCKHWIDTNSYITQGYSEDYKYCEIAEVSRSNGMLDAICSAEGIGGELITHKDFGCVLHNSR